MFSPQGSGPLSEAPAVHFVDGGRQPPPKCRSWDEWLLTQKDNDRDGGPWLAAYRRLERVLAELVPSFANGRLERRIWEDRRIAGGGRETRQELVWWTEADRQLRFEEQGSGVRALKDLLVAATAGAGLCLIEEPELHLSEAMQMQLRGHLERLAGQGAELKPLQIILTSHTAMFDHESARKV